MEADRAKALTEIEGQFQMAIRDALNRTTRKPFYWGGLKGYRQLESIAQALHRMPVADHAYFQRLLQQVDRTVENNRQLAERLDQAFTWLLRIAACLRYPPSSYLEVPEPTSQQVKQELQALLQDLETEARHQALLRALYDGLRKRWEMFADDLLYCFAIPGLPQDNLMLESVFGRLRCHQRRISGRKSTQPLRDFGQVQILFLAESEEQLLEQIREVSVEEYRQQRSRQAQAETPRKFLNRLHRNPAKTMQDLAAKYMAHLPTQGPFVGPVSEWIPQYTA
jgi:hypothetical protein